MATRPLSTNLPADLPENWANGQIVAPSGGAVGLSEKHGYNYQSKQINDAQGAINTINAAFDGIVPTTRKIAGKALTGDITLNKNDIDLSNVDNTSDANKPVSTPQQEALNQKSNKPTYVQKTIAASGWQGNKTYSFATEYPFASYDLEMSLAEGVTDAQRDAYANAMIVGSILGNYIQALGEVPTINIPVYLKVTAK